jgi:hypothetical protein
MHQGILIIKYLLRKSQQQWLSAGFSDSYRDNLIVYVLPPRAYYVLLTFVIITNVSQSQTAI